MLFFIQKILRFNLSGVAFLKSMSIYMRYTISKQKYLPDKLCDNTYKRISQMCSFTVLLKFLRDVVFFTDSGK